MLQFEFSEKFKKHYKKLPQQLQKKVDKQILFLQQDITHPSLRVKRMKSLDCWEARVDRSYRLTFTRTEDVIILRTVGMHDEGLGKK